MDDLSFQPNWFSKPGDTIATLMVQRKMTLRQLADELSVDPAIMRGLIAGAVDVDENLAIRLAGALGGTPTFWIKRQSSYAAALSRAVENAGPNVSAWIQKFPQREMREYGWIPKTAKRSDTLRSYLAYFGVSNPKEWELRYTAALTDVAFRTSSAFESKAGALSAWLRQGEMQASTVRTSNWSEKFLRQKLPELRKLSLRKTPSNFIPQVQTICAAAGIAVVFVRAPSGCRASGATRFIAPGKAMIVLSFRYRSDDHFWFTFFHEIGHLILHGKEATFVDCEGQSESDREKEANDFAASVLVPPTRHEELLSLRPRMEPVVRFAVSVGVAPGIVVGQLQHLGAIGRNQLNFLKRRYDWGEIDSAI